MTSQAKPQSFQATRRSALELLSRRLGAGLVLPPLLVYLVLFLAPIGVFSLISFFHPSVAGFYEPVLTLGNYLKFFTDRFYPGVLLNTLKLSVLVTGLAVLLGYPVAYLLSRMTPAWRKLLLVVLLFPLFTSNVVRAYGWIVILGRIGIVNSVLLQLGLIRQELDLLYTFGAVVVGLLTIELPYMIINITNALVTIDPRIEEAARVTGASPWQTFWRVTLPLSLPGVVSGSLLVFGITMSAYVIPFLLGGPQVKTMGSLVYDFVAAFNWPFASAIAVVLVVTTLVTTTAFIAFLRNDRGSGRYADGRS